MEEMAKKNKFESEGENNAYRFYRNPVTNQRMIIDRKTGEIKFQNWRVRKILWVTLR